MKKPEIRNKHLKRMEEKKKFKKSVDADQKSHQSKKQATVHYLSQTEWSPDEIIP